MSGRLLVPATVVLWLAASAGLVPAQDAIPLTYVSVPQARLASWEDADGVLGRRFVEELAARGSIHRPDELPEEAHRALSRWRESVRHTVVVLAVDATAASSPREERLLHLGPPESPVRLRWVGAEPSRDASVLTSLLPGHQAWLYESNALRWEEVGEFLDLTREENTALRRLEEPGHPLWELREAFANDKRRTNLAVYLSRSGTPRALGLQLDLPSVYELPVRDLWSGILEEDSLLTASVSETGSLAKADPAVWAAAERRLFARRLQGSRGRVYGRLDRVLQSLYGEMRTGGILVIDARDSLDPFVATIGRDVPAQWWTRIPPAP